MNYSNAGGRGARGTASREASVQQNCLAKMKIKAENLLLVDHFIINTKVSSSG